MKTELRCDECADWSCPDTPFKAGVIAHARYKHARAAHPAELLPRPLPEQKDAAAPCPRTT